MDDANDWRAMVPASLRYLPDMVTISDIAKFFGYSGGYVRRLRHARLKADNRGDMGECLDALPPSLTMTTRPLYWRTEDIIRWGIQTGRIDPDTGSIQRLHSPGRPPKSARSR